MDLTTDVLAMLVFTLLSFWGVATAALVLTLRQESRKVEILEHQDQMDTYSPTALAELREWIEKNPDDPLVEEARSQYNECVKALKETDNHFYDWDRTAIESLEQL
ncbi:hypothetical protein [Natronococcus sp. A-GB7]|uniref:hypothetical protein n=1 Tax=Natronococcus sp. A-GB7 TaxID=3037649 RepID=UPI00241BE8D4|nr:hypothetical protein [Natronococcus sp. A-GB7]MDG5817332.1 hypothetical protein [Natronococcus sp. A-GB7]